MRKAVAILTCALAAPLVAIAQTAPRADAGKEQAHRKEDIARHRTISKAHEEAARCLEAGTDEKQCHQQLRAACKGIAVGPYCGMRHAH